MKYIATICLFIFLAIPAQAQKTDKAVQTILDIMQAQENAWNAGNLDAFMTGYWNSDSLKFIGSRGLTYGWKQTLANYKQSYPDKAAMGKLTFTILSVDKTSKNSAFVIGKWHLKRDKDEPHGHFTLLWKKMSGRWVIVADHSS